jgi:hypothetical protein
LWRKDWFWIKVILLNDNVKHQLPRRWKSPFTWHNEKSNQNNTLAIWKFPSVSKIDPMIKTLQDKILYLALWSQFVAVGVIVTVTVAAPGHGGSWEDMRGGDKVVVGTPSEEEEPAELVGEEFEARGTLLVDPAKELLTFEIVLKKELVGETVNTGATEAHEVEILKYDPLSTSITKQVCTSLNGGVAVAVAVTVTGTDVVTTYY